MNTYKLKINNHILGQFWSRCLAVVLFLFSVSAFSQSTPKVSSEIDTTFIKIGEQIQYKITVEADSTDLVIFPEDQTFSPLEMVEALTVDTTKNKNRVILQRIYTLTQFDSGAYTIPQQRIAINEKPFFTDSVRISVATVPVDTVAQKMYDIKPLINVDKNYSGWWKTLLWILIPLLLLLGLVYWFFIRKTPLTEEEKEALLPPYDRALMELKRLENSRYLIQDEYKKYYSELTDIVRSYLEEDVHVSALESTTDQLINKLELLRNSGELDLDDATIIQFKKILQTADLVKFAKSKPELSIAEQDRKAVEQIVVKTHDAIPEPTEEELLLNEEYLEELAKKKQRKKWILATIIFGSVLVLSVVGSVIYYGYDYVKDTVIGHPTKELLEGEWVRSSYGSPPITIETPQVLLRQEVELPPEAKAAIKEIQTFGYRSSIGLFTIATTSTTFTQPAEPDFEKAIEQLIQSFESNGAKNIITKQEEFSTISGTKGIKTYGSGNFVVPESKDLIKGKYIILCFGGKGFQQYVLLSWLNGDVYAEKVVDRIINSVEVKTQL